MACIRLFLALGLISTLRAAAPDATVATDGSGNYTSVQAAIEAAPAGSTNPWVIAVKPGRYQGHIAIPATKPFLTLRGEDAATTIITDDKNFNSPGTSGAKITTPDSATAHIQANSFTAENITFENTTTLDQHIQALALYMTGDRGVFRHCRFLGWQDTLRADSPRAAGVTEPDAPRPAGTARQYYVDCYIEGHVDFIYAAATAVFDHCHIHAKADGYLTAPSTPQAAQFGYVFLDCKVTTGPDVQKGVYLGRPWRPFAATAFIRTELAGNIRPEGWNNWGKASNEQTARYAEYGSTGPGAKPAERVKWAKHLTEEDAKIYTVEKILAGSDGWNPLGRPTSPAPSKPKTVWDYPHTGEPPIAKVEALFDVGLRDTAITRGPDGTYYLTGTIGPNFMTANEGIRIWKSKDLTHWDDLGLVWSLERDGTWQKEWTVKNGQRRRAVWAPEVHYLKGNFYIAYCVTGLGTGLLKSTTGRPEGPYVSATIPDAPLTKGIDASLFVEDDGTPYFVFGSGRLARLKDDLSGLAEAPVRLRCEVADADLDHHHPSRPCAENELDHVGFEGVFLFKANGRYYLSCAERYYERYHCMTAESPTLRGPYSARYVSVPYAGHNTFFQDAEGHWWSTMFGNDPQAPIQKHPGILRVEFDQAGHIRPLVDGAVWTPTPPPQSKQLPISQ